MEENCEIVEESILPKDYGLSLLKEIQNFKQKEANIKDYIEEFQRLSIRFDH